MDENSKYSHVILSCDAKHCQLISLKAFNSLPSVLTIQAIEDVFRVSIASSKHEGELGELETVMQTRDAVSGLHNCREYSQLPQVFR